MEFSFTDDQVERLYDAFEHSERLRVVACNGLGHKCELEGYIGIVSSEEFPEAEENADTYFPGIFANSLMLDTGKISKYPKEYFRTPHSVLLFTDFTDLELPSQPLLYIQSIRSLEKSDIIYCNYDFDYLQTYFDQSQRALEKDRLKNGRMFASLDKEGKMLIENVGKPMKFDDNEGILTCPTDILPNGDIFVFGINGSNIFTTSLKSDRTIKFKDGVLCDVPKQKENKEVADLESRC